MSLILNIFSTGRGLRRVIRSNNSLHRVAIVSAIVRLDVFGTPKSVTILINVSTPDYLEDCLSFARELAWRATNAGIGHRGLASNVVGESIRAYNDPQRKRTRDYDTAMTRHFGRSGLHSAVPRRNLTIIPVGEMPTIRPGGFVNAAPLLWIGWNALQWSLPNRFHFDQADTLRTEATACSEIEHGRRQRQAPKV
jgi:hypothetical protein